jgi:hypothetical protein
MQLPHSPAAKVHFAIKTLARKPLGYSHACFADTIYNECKISPENEPTVLHIFGNKRGLARRLASWSPRPRDDGGIQKLKKPITGA